MASRELEGIPGYHNIKSAEAREIMQPYLKTDGHYLMRPSGDSKGGVLCTICVTNRIKLVNYRLTKDVKTGKFYIHSHTSFPTLQQLLGHYKDSPINPDVNTRLLSPILSQQQQQQPSFNRSNGTKPQKSMKKKPPPLAQHDSKQMNGSDDHYVTMEKKADAVSNDRSSSSDDEDIPGLHLYLPKTEINAVMTPYLNNNGCYLVRPSASMEGQLTLAVSHSGKVLNFKINCEGGDYFIAPKRRFRSARALLESYRSVPIKSKKAANEKIFLLHPITVDPTLEQKHKKLLEEKVARKSSSNIREVLLAPSGNDPLPHPWQEHFNEQYRKKYFFNPETNVSVWERPKSKASLAPALPPARKTATMKGRPLPTMPGSASPGGPQAVQPSSKTLKPSRHLNEPMPLPGQQNGGPSWSPSHKSLKELSPPPTGHMPPLPPKDGSPRPSVQREQPPLPPKEESGGFKSHPPLPPKDDKSGNNPPLPPKDRGTGQLVASNPPLPPRVGGSQHRPGPSPSSSTSSSNSTRPPLPVPNDVSALSAPPLPSKEQSPTPPFLPPLPPKSDTPSSVPMDFRKSPAVVKKEKRIVEYEDTVIKSRPKSPSLPARMPSNNVPPPPPPLPGVAVATPTGGAPPPAPPPPAIVTPAAQDCVSPPLAAAGGGAPPPPPPPPMMPPPPSPNPVRATRAETFSSPGFKHSNNKAPPSPQIDAASGRPFGAGDLQAAKGLLKRRSANDPSPEPPRDQGGMMSIFSNALDSKMKSIRQAVAVVDSDEESEFDSAEDDDDDWD